MSLPTAAEATPITIEIPAANLQLGDQIGSQDVSQPALYQVIGLLRRARMRVLARVLADGTEVIRIPRPAERVFVRRYAATATITRAATGNVHVTTVVLRPVGALTTIEDPSRLRLQAGDGIVLTAPD